MIVAWHAAAWTRALAVRTEEAVRAFIASSTVPESGDVTSVATASDGAAAATVTTALGSVGERALLVARRAEPLRITDVTQRTAVVPDHVAASADARCSGVARAVTVANVVNRRLALQLARCAAISEVARARAVHFAPASACANTVLMSRANKLAGNSSEPSFTCAFCRADARSSNGARIRSATRAFLVTSSARVAGVAKANTIAELTVTANAVARADSSAHVGAGFVTRRAPLSRTEIANLTGLTAVGATPELVADAPGNA